MPSRYFDFTCWAASKALRVAASDCTSGGERPEVLVTLAVPALGRRESHRMLKCGENDVTIYRLVGGASPRGPHSVSR